MEIDMGNRCTNCFRDTTLWMDSTRPLVKRTPSSADATLVLGENDGVNEGIEIPVTVNGYMCSECQPVEY